MIFAPRTNKYSETQKLVGAYVSNEEAAYLSLCALYHDTSMSGIIRELVKTYIKENEKEDFIYKSIAEKAHKEWRTFYLNNRGLAGWRGWDQVDNRWDDFKTQARNNLKKRKINIEVIDKIIDCMEELEIEKDGE